MPNRIIRDGINSSSRINALSEGAELLYRRLITVVDDYGRFYASPSAVRGACWPTAPHKATEGQVVAWLGEMQTGKRPLVTVYYVDDCMYMQLNDFDQRVRTRSKFPDPSAAVCPQIDSSLSADCQQVDSKVRSLGGGVVRIAEAEARGAEVPPRAANCVPISHPPPDAEKRIRALAQKAPDRQDEETGIERAVQELLSAAHPDSVLAEMERNIPAWWDAMRDGRARIKTLRFVIIDRDYLRRPREPTKSIPVGIIDQQREQKRKELMAD